MGSKKRVDLEAKLFDPHKRGCMAVLVGPRKVGEIDYEVHHDGAVRMKTGIRGARLPDGARRVTIFVNDTAVTELEVERGRGFVRLDSVRGDAVPQVGLEDVVEARVGETILGQGEFRPD